MIKIKQSRSLGSFFIYKRFLKAGSTYDILVAECTYRPQFADQNMRAVEGYVFITTVRCSMRIN